MPKVPSSSPEQDCFLDSCARTFGSKETGTNDSSEQRPGKFSTNDVDMRGVEGVIYKQILTPGGHRVYSHEAVPNEVIQSNIQR